MPVDTGSLVTGAVGVAGIIATWRAGVSGRESAERLHEAQHRHEQARDARDLRRSVFVRLLAAVDELSDEVTSAEGAMTRLLATADSSERDAVLSLRAPDAVVRARDALRRAHALVAELALVYDGGETLALAKQLLDGFGSDISGLFDGKPAAGRGAEQGRLIVAMRAELERAASL